jgi:methyl-accepting chemotaxis protein
MTKNYIYSLLSDKTFHFLSIIILVFLIFGFTGYFCLNQYFHVLRAEQLIPAANTPMLIGRYFIVGSLIVSAIFILWIVLSIFKKAIKPYNDLIKTGCVLAEKDCTNLTSNMSELAQGNLATMLSFQTEPILEKKVTSELGKFADILNEMIQSLNETATEFNAITDIPCRRLCYVGADSFLEGRKCGEVMGEVTGGKGEVAIITASFKASGLELRRKGFESMLREKYPEIQIVDVKENHDKIEESYSIAKDLIKRYSQLSGIYVTEGGTPSGVAKAIFELKKKGKVKIICHDLTDEVMPYVKDGVVTATLGQDPFAQGHDPVIHLFNYAVAGWRPSTPRLLSHMDVVKPENYKQFWKEGRGVIQSASKQYAQPVEKMPERPLKIMVLGKEDSVFWYPVRDGVLAAAKELERFNVKVEWIPQETKDFVTKASDLEPYFERLISEGYDGLSMVVHDKEIVPYINKIVDAGIPVITFNSEPASLRGLIYTIMEQAEKLMGMSENLASSSYQVDIATTQINNAMHEMARGTVSQNEEVYQTQETVESLLDNISQVNQEATESTKASENTEKAVNQGTEAMEKTLTSMRTIEKSVGDTWHIVEELGKHSERIDIVVDLIDNIASRVNVLALNAAIEATRAGEYGKGFMAVANEIRKLAKNTADATREVTELVNTVQSGIHKVEKVISVGLDRIKESATMTESAQNLLGDIHNLVKKDRDRMQKIAGAITEMQRSSYQVGETMGSVALVSEKNTKTVEQVNSATQQVSAQLKEVAALAKLLEQMSKGEQQLLVKFNVSA